MDTLYVMFQELVCLQFESTLNLFIMFMLIGGGGAEGESVDCYAWTS